MEIFPLICEIQTRVHHSQFKNRQQYSNQQRIKLKQLKVIIYD